MEKENIYSEETKSSQCLKCGKDIEISIDIEYFSVCEKCKNLILKKINKQI